MFFDVLISPSFGEAFHAYSVFLLRASLSRNAWSGALLTQDEALGRVGLTVTLSVALPATLFISVSLIRSGHNAGFLFFLLFLFFLFPSYF